MGALDSNGIYIYSDTDNVVPLATTLNLGMSSVSAAFDSLGGDARIKPVANATERNAYEQEMRNSGYHPSPTSPLYVDRADTGALERHRGDRWREFVQPEYERYEVPTRQSSGWNYYNIIEKRNNWVLVSINMERIGNAWSGNADLILSGEMPPRFRPNQTTDSVGLAVSHSRPFSLRANPSGNVVGYNINITSGWLRGNIAFPVST